MVQTETDRSSMGLNLNQYSLAKPLSQFLDHVSKIKDNHSKLSEIEGYVGKLEEERKKIEVFKRELPLSMLLLNEAIERLKEEASSVMMSSKVESDNKNKKKNWMSSAQLWISNSNSLLHSTNEEEEEDRCVSPQTPSQTCNKPDQGGAILSFNLPPPPPPLPAPTLSIRTPTSEILTDYRRTEQSHHHHIQKKEQRRRWSEDLHRMFLDALRMIGGSQVATPKQIRDIMKVDGLTNDEVKSHLQKYRMHNRKHPSKTFSSACDQQQPTQRLISLSRRSESPQGPLLVDRGLFSNNVGHSSEDEEKSDGRSSWRSDESNKKRQTLLDLEL